MFDVFSEQVEVLIKDGMANLYWYHGDLHKAWQRSGISEELCRRISELRDPEGRKLSKRQQMDVLYQNIRHFVYDRRLEISRNFVRILAEHKNFIPQDRNHRIETAERAALKLREMIIKQEKDKQFQHQSVLAQQKSQVKKTYHEQLGELQNDFIKARDKAAQERGYDLEKLFVSLMKISGIPVTEPFRIKGEQHDGAIKFDGHFYLVELKWISDKIDPKEIGHFHYKVEGKLEARGIFLAMNGYTTGVSQCLPQGRQMKIILFDGIHFANVLSGTYTFKQLIDHAIQEASLKGNLYCAHDIRS